MGDGYIKSICPGFIIRHLIIITVFISVGFIAAVYYHVIISVEELVKKRDKISKVAQSSLSIPIWQINNKPVKDFTASLFIDDDVIYVNVFSGSESIIKKARPEYEEMTFSQFASSPKYLVKESRIAYKNESIGLVQIVLSRETVENIIKKDVILSIILLIFILTLIVLFHVWLFRQKIIIPLFQIENMMKDILSGKENANNYNFHNDEMGRIAEHIRNINDIIINLNSSNDDISKKLKTCYENLQINQDKKTVLSTIAQISNLLVYEWSLSDDTLEWYGNVGKHLGFDDQDGIWETDTFLDMVHPHDKKMLYQSVEDNRINPESNHYIYRMRHKNGTYRYFEDRRLPLTDKNGQTIKWIGVCKDITVGKT